MKEKGGLKNIINLLKFDKKYWMLFAVLVLLILYQKIHFSTNENMICPSENSIIAGGYSLQADQTSYTVANILNSKAGDYYRINFKMQQVSKSCDSGQNIDCGTTQQTKVDINLLGQNGNKTKIQEIAFDQDNQPHAFEFVFKTDASYRDLEFHRIANEGTPGPIKVDEDIRLTRLNVTSDSELVTLRPTQSGEPKSYNSSPDLSVDKSKAIYSFNHSGQTLGQTFRAQSSEMSGINLKLLFPTSGNGLYHLSLHQIDGNNIDKHEITSFDFNINFAQCAYQASLLSKIYQFTLIAKLQTGKEYAVLLDDNNVSVSLIHKLQVFGFESNQYNDGQAGNVKRYIMDNDIGDTYFSIIYPEKRNENLAHGAIIEDLGGGTSEYQFQNKGLASDVLDITYSAGTSVVYDKNQQAITAPAKDDNSFVYKIDFTSMPKNIFIHANDIGGNYVNSTLEYSFDQSNWQKIDSEFDYNSPYFFDKILNQDLGRILYLKVSYDKADAGYKNIKYFGLKTLKVNAETIN